MIKHISLIITKVADGVFSEMRIIKGKYLQIRQSIQIKHLFEATNFIAAYIQVI